MGYCDICLKSRNSIRIKTVRKHVCQWCINWLYQNPLNPNYLRKVIKGKIDLDLKFSDRFQIPTYSAIRQGVEKQFGKPSFWDKIFSNKEYKSKTQLIECQTKAILNQKQSAIEAELIFAADQEFNRLMNELYPPESMFSNELHYKAVINNLISWKIIEGRLTKDKWDTLASSVREQDNFRCCICGAIEGELHVHHIIPVSKYGTNSPENLVTLCYNCHKKQHKMHEGVVVTKHNPSPRKKRRKSEVIKRYESYIAYDFETTGFHPEKGDRVIEIGALKVIRGKIIGTFHSLVDAGIDIPENIQKLTGITNDTLKNQPKPEDAFMKFFTFIGSEPLISHNIAFDFKFLKAELSMIGISTGNDTNCTLKLSRRLLPKLENHKLETVFSHINSNMHRGTWYDHRALDDARKVVIIWEYLVNNYLI